MKRISLLTLMICSAVAWSQEHFTGVSTSDNAGLMNVMLNPAAAGNAQNGIYVNMISISGNLLNNKIGYSDLISGKNFERAIFSGNDPANLRLDGQILGPSISWKIDKWAFFFTSSANTQANIINLDNSLGNAIVNDMIDVTGAASILSRNQRANGMAWGELGVGLAREVFSINGHSLYAGAQFKWMLAGAYVDMAASSFTGKLAIQGNNVLLTDASARLNFSYSGSLGDDFTRIPNYMDYLGKPGGMSTDLGLSYTWKMENESAPRVTAGVSIKNIGSVSFKDQNSSSNTYLLNIPDGQYFNLSQFKDEGDIKVIEQRLQQSGFLTVTNDKQNFKVKTPTLFILNANVKVYDRFYLGAVLQQKTNSETKENQLNAQDVVTFIPRYRTDNFEVFLPVSHYQISGTAAGVGMRYRAFFIGSGSVLTGLLNNSNTRQVDGYIGFRIAI